MKVAIPVLSSSNTQTISKSVFECDSLAIFDKFMAGIEFIPLNELTEKAGNLSIALKRAGIRGLVANNMDIVELGLFEESGFTIFKSLGLNVEENIKMLQNNQLAKVSLNSMLGTDCSKSSCGSCNSCH